ncbi:hypothetical protein Cgig2_034206 [Carnegiea gigantea]|uniref:Agenet domain-containing protein n=1 Tax=Carnegiea gigantea TaxID=171969 RepID=A0A9Q1JLB3_9CARY|nr:hypothetical protein Cgig2_034206 [Carnegiea gigantea]
MPNFQRGDRVEVLCTDEGFKGAYYPATIVAQIDAGEYLIQYDTLLRDDELAPLREMVSPAALRPMPPEIPAGKFVVRGKVDVFANDGWWVGKVIKRLPGRGRTYLVFFESNGELQEATILASLAWFAHNKEMSKRETNPCPLLLNHLLRNMVDLARSGKTDLN